MAVKPCQSNLEFVFTRTSDSSGSTADNENFFLKTDWSFGFRIGMGMKPRCFPWSFRADYTYWHNCVGDAVGITNNTSGQQFDLIPAIGGDLRLIPGSSASTTTTLEYDYQQLDLTAGWSCCVCSGLELIPYGGFRALWYSTDLKETNTDSQNIVYSAAGDTSTAENDYDAYGIVGGLRLNYHLCNCFHFYGRIGGSFLAGHNDLRTVTFVSQATVSTANFKEEICLHNRSLEGGWGIVYDTCACGYATYLGVGYEAIQWNEHMPNPFGENNFTEDDEGLFIQSITFKFGIAF